MKIRYVLSPNCLPQALPVNTLCLWLLAIEVYDIGNFGLVVGWTLFALLLVAKALRANKEQYVDMFEDYAERQAVLAAKDLQ